MYPYQTNQRNIQATTTQLNKLSDRFGIEFVPIPGGTFMIGNPSGIGADDEQPQHAVTLDNFWIGKTEVTNRQYRYFVEANGYTQRDWWTEAGWQRREEQLITETLYLRDEQWNQPDQPVVGISWYEAIAYTRWLSTETGLTIRLPTEAEWERSARGDDGRIYPWGNNPPTDQLLNYNSNLGRTSTVGSYPAGASPYGVLDLAGNVWEWTSSRSIGYPYDKDDGRENVEGSDTRTLRGGAWNFNSDDVRAAYRLRYNPNNRNLTVGLRLVAFPGF